MTCYGPLTAYYSKEVGKSGKRGITFDRNASFSGVPMKLPCGQCVGCRLDRSLQWAVRCMHEKQLHRQSSFVTLTYDDEHLPEGGSLVVRDHQLFMKRLRKRHGAGVRFFMCGEYGERTRRPHYHYLFFNLDFRDKKFYKMARAGSRLYSSEGLSELWPAGLNVIGDVTLESCAYVARYIVDKVTGERAEAHYAGRVPEFTAQSRRPGIATDWYSRFGVHSHVSGDFCVLDGKRVRVPRFYDNKYELLDPDSFVGVKRDRARSARRYRLNNTRDRLRVREVVALRKLRLFSKEI